MSFFGLLKEIYLAYKEYEPEDIIVEFTKLTPRYYGIRGAKVEYQTMRYNRYIDWQQHLDEMEADGWRVRSFKHVKSN
jgi:hypothetical protein